MSKNVVVVLQHSNWEDSGGDHDPILVSVSDELFDELETHSRSTSLSCPESVRDAVRKSKRISAPCTVDAVFNIWYDF